MTTAADRLAAAQTARAAARRAFNDAVSDATQEAISRKLRSVEAIEAAVEAHPAVIAARAASAVAIAELDAAEAAATAAERLSLVTHGARVSAAAMTESPSMAAAPDHDEDSCITSGGDAPADGSPAALWTEISALSVAEAEAEYTTLRDRREALYATAHQRPTRGIGTREATVRDEVEAQRAASEEHAATELRAHLLSRRAPGLHAAGCSLCAQVSAGGTRGRGLNKSAT